MAISETVILPGQPVSGTVREVPLQGNGYLSPHSVTQVRINATADASGGNATIIVQFDPRWVSVIGWVGFLIGGLAADQLVQFSYRVTANHGVGVVLTVPDSSIAGVSPQVSWSPPPIFASVPTVGATQPNLRSSLTNTDGDSYTLDMAVFNFAKDVLTQTPYSLLVQSFPRGVAAA